MQRRNCIFWLWFFFIEIFSPWIKSFEIIEISSSVSFATNKSHQFGLHFFLYEIKYQEKETKQNFNNYVNHIVERCMYVWKQIHCKFSTNQSDVCEKYFNTGWVSRIIRLISHRVASSVFSQPVWLWRKPLLFRLCLMNGLCR